MTTGEQKDGKYGNNSGDKTFKIHPRRMQKPEGGDKQFFSRVNAGFAAYDYFTGGVVEHIGAVPLCGVIKMLPRLPQ